MIQQQVQDDVINAIIKAEGGYTNDPTDRGGATNFGITQATLEAYSGVKQTPASVKALTLQEAKKIYTANYAAPYVALNNPIIFKFLVNTAVQHGQGGAAKIIQTALGIAVDGAMGPNTKAKLQAAEGEAAKLLANLVAARLRYYTNIVKKNPSQIKYICGWANRIAGDLS